SLAIVGQNGAGKTTLAKLLCRLYDPQSGAIEVDGVDLADLDLDSWRGRVAAVFQDFVRFELTLRENVVPRQAEGGGLGGVAGPGPAERGVAGPGPAERGVAGPGPAERGVAGPGPAEPGAAGAAGLDDAVGAALAEAGAGALAGLDTVLAKGYSGGTDLSGGQWQRVALARALAAVRLGAGLVL